MSGGFFHVQKGEVMSRKNKKRDPPEKWESRSEHERFIRILESMYESPAFISLPANSVRLYLILKNEYRGNYTGNKIVCTYDTIVAHGISRNTIRPNLRILEALGFIVMEEGTLMREASIYHFSDKWKEISDIKTAKQIVKEVRKQVQWEKDKRQELCQTYGDK